MTDLVALVADLIPRPAEIESFPPGDWRSFTDRADALARIRQEKAARAILAALGMESRETDHG